MSLYLPDQKLGSHSQPGSSSNKFVLKGRQTGSMHRGHTWVFRAETYETMLAWYEDVKKLTEVSGEERNAFVRRHARSVSQGSTRSVSSDGLEEDEADEVPYSANQSIANEAVRDEIPQRPSPGGRFPSDIQLDRDLQQPLSSNSSEVGNDLTTASGDYRVQVHILQILTTLSYKSHRLAKTLPPFPMRILLDTTTKKPIDKQTLHITTVTTYPSHLLVPQTNNNHSKILRQQLPTR